MLKILKYYRPVVVGKVVSSCDNVILDGKLDYRANDKLIKYLECLDSKIILEYWESFKIGNYRHQWTLKFPYGSSCTIQLSLNDCTKPNNLVRLDYNPNKCNSDYDFVQVHNFFIGCCSRLELKRWDFALDYPVERENCFLIKDQRKYRQESYSLSDKTEYLGIRSHVNYCKLYNKKIESKLDKPLTRLEITCDGLSTYEGINIPLVYVLDTQQMLIDELSLGGTDRFILNALLNDLGNIKMLGRDKQDKMQNILDKYTHTLDVGYKSYYEVLKTAREQVQSLSCENTYNYDESIKIKNINNLEFIESDIDVSNVFDFENKKIDSAKPI